MNIAEYQKIIPKFDKYPKDKLPESYLYGIADEAGELSEKIDMVFFENLPISNEELILEIGDIHWYLTSLMTYFGFDVNDIHSETKKYPAKGATNMVRLTLKLSIYISQLLGLMKKILRDNGGKIGYEQLIKIRSKVILINKTLYEIEVFYGFTLDDVLNANYEKLSSRLKRNKIHGDGDKR